MRRVAPLACLLTLWFAASPATADQFSEVRDWLDRMASAMRNLNYQGTFVYARGEQLETIRLTHVRTADGVHERMVAISGPLREIVRDGNGVRAVLGEQEQPQQDPLLTGAVFPDFSVAAMDRARERYRFTVGDLDRIAGHQGRKIAIEPRDRYRYGYELWLEERSGLLLRWVLLDGTRRALAKLMFTELRTGEDVKPDDSQTETAPGRFFSIEAKPPQLDPAGAMSEPPDYPDDLPPGFDLAAHARSENGSAYQHFVFSDGLASVSVYLEPVGGEGGIPPGLSRMGTTNAWSRSGTTRRITAIGEVPPVTLKTIGQAFLTASDAP